MPIAFYLVYTVHYSFVLHKNVFLTGRRKIINFVLIWILPFIWIQFLKTFFKFVPGSHEAKRKKTESFTESGLGVWDDGSHNHSNNDD